MAGFMLLPPPPDHCRICAAKHEPEMFHDATTLFFATRFQMRYGRAGTWADATAHCEAYVVEALKGVLQRLGIAWTEPPAGVAPIAEPIDG